jgi:hypothetical protein
MSQSGMTVILRGISEPLLIPFVRSALDTIVSIPSRERPWGVWFARHAPVSAEWVHHLATPVTGAWFYDGYAVRRRDLWTYARFFTVHQVQPRCARRDGEFYDVRDIGSVRFALRQGYVDRAYVEGIWRSRSGACIISGYEVTWDATYAITERHLLWEGGAISITRLQRGF